MKAAVFVMDYDAHAFHMECIKREVGLCRDVDRLQELTLAVLDLMEGQRQFFLDYFTPKL